VCVARRAWPAVGFEVAVLAAPSRAPSKGSEFAWCGSRARATAFVGARTLGTSGCGLVRTAASVGTGPPPPPRGFPRGPLGRVRAKRDAPLWAVASTSSGTPSVSAIGVRRCHFGSSQNGNGWSNTLATRVVTVVPVLSGGGRRPRPTCRDKPVCLGPARVSGPRQGVAWRPGGLHGRCGGGPLQPVGFAK